MLRHIIQPMTRASSSTKKNILRYTNKYNKNRTNNVYNNNQNKINPYFLLNSSQPKRILYYHTTKILNQSDEDEKEKKSIGFFDREHSVAPEGFNRWLAVPAGTLITASIGAVYAWSSFNAPLCRTMGVVAPAASDWDLGSVVPIFSACAIGLGVATATLGSWAEREGPRKTAGAASFLWAGGLIVASIGTYTHILPLCYLGYGVGAGMGWGLGYISPVSNLMKWFPDKRGLATGMALASFGGGAILAAPMNKYFIEKFFVAPEYLGTLDTVNVVTEEGKRFVDFAGEMKEVVVATAAEVSKLPGELVEGVYVVGTGSTGVAETFLALGTLHFAAMMTGTLLQKVPREGWKPEGWVGDDTAASMVKEPEEEGSTATATTLAVPVENAMKTKQFWLMWFGVFGNAIAGVSVMACAKNIIGDVFASAFPAIITAGFMSGYIASLSAANGGGRFAWAAISDYIGRKNTTMIFGLSIPFALGLPYLTTMVTEGGGGTLPLTLFYAGSVLVISLYGGIFSVLPAQISDNFGLKHAGAIHGRALTAWSTSAVVGPKILTTLRQISVEDAISDLVDKCDPTAFYDRYGAPVENLKELIETKTVTIPSLMEIVPPGTLDPTPHLYDTTFYAMSGIIGAALLCNALVVPVARKHFVESDKI